MNKHSLIPSPGQSVYLRSQFFRVNAVSPLSAIPHKTPQHLISLSQMNEKPKSLQVIWELEINPISNHSIQTPLPHNKHSLKYDPYPLLQSILLAHQCSDSIKIHQRCLLSPLKNSLETHPFQFVPAYRTLNNPRINLFLADHVGLGKSIEAGLLISELLAKRRAQRILILCPANLQSQWQQLLLKHFSLNFQIVNRQFIQQFHKIHGLTSNPWKNSCFAISSLDFLKQFNQTQLFLQSLKNRNQPMRPWDLLVIDEAHRITPKNLSSIRQSERTKLAKTLIPLFEHRLFISATPHNGNTQHFKALLQLLDPLKFSTKKQIDPEILKTTLIRRPKSLIQSLSPELGLKLPKRIVKFLPFQFSKLEQQLQISLDHYIQLALQSSKKQSLKLVTIILKKRLLSSIHAFSISFRKHIHFNRDPKPLSSINPEQQLFDPSWLLLEQESLENKLFLKTANLFHSPKLNKLAEDILQQLQNPKLNDSKTKALKDSIHKSKDKVIVFSEYIDSIQYLADKLPAKQCLTLTSQLTLSEQSNALNEFRSNASRRILLATDVAAEGLNLQFAAHKVIHFDIPWNPARLEQRNGRVDRYAQPKPTVHCLHFLATNSKDHLILKKAILKIKTVREDLGPNNQVIADEIESALLQQDPSKIKQGPNKTPPDSHISLREHTLEINKISKLIHNTQTKFQLSNSNQRRLINSALNLLDFPPLQHSRRGWTIGQVPNQWRHPNPDLDTKPNSLIFQTHKKLHLNHPILKHALQLLTNQQPDSSFHKTPTRIALIPSNQRFHSIRLFQRIAWFNTLGAKIHEFNVQLSGRLHPHKIQWLTQKQNPIPKAPRGNLCPNQSTIQFIEQYSKIHSSEIDKAICKLKDRERSRAKRALRKIRQKRLLHERQTCLLKLSELQQRKRQLKQSRQRLLWPIELLAIMTKESDSLSLRESQLQNQLNNIPKQISKQLTLHTDHGLQMTPVATLYFYPKQ